MDKISPRMEAELIGIFRRFDADASGFIEEAEFHKILNCLGYDRSAEVRSLEFAAIDSDRDGKVSFREFADWWLNDHQSARVNRKPNSP